MTNDPASPIANDPEISIVLPCLNEAETVVICIRRAQLALHEMGMSGEILVVDNGSTDGTVETAEASGARVIREAVRGYGSALRRGFAEARGKYLVMADADDSYDLSDLERFIAPLRANEADFVLGSRLDGTILPGALRWHHRWLGVPFLTWMLNALFGTRISDAHCGMRSLTREAERRMQCTSTGMEYASEMLIEIPRLGLRLTQIPITYRPDARTRRSNLRPFRDGTRHMLLLLRLARTRRPPSQ